MMRTKSALLFAVTLCISSLLLYSCGNGKGTSGLFGFPTTSGDHTITATSGNNGAISPAGDVGVGDGGDITFAFIPSAGYRVESVIVDGDRVGAFSSYMFSDVIEDHTIEVLFTPYDGLQWEVVTPGPVDSSAAEGTDGTLYIGSDDSATQTRGYIFAINPDGSTKWRFDTLGNVDSSPAIGSDGTIYAGSDNNDIYALNPDGTQKWVSRFPTRGNINTSPAIAMDGTLFIGTSGDFDDDIYAIDANGNQKWRYDGISGLGGVNSSAAIAPNGVVYMAGGPCQIQIGIDDTAQPIFATAQVCLFAFKDFGFAGAEIWRFDLTQAVTEGGLDADSFADFDSSPAIGTDGTIYIGSISRYLYAINPDGTLKWSYETGGDISSSPAIGTDGTIYVGSADRHLYAFTPQGALRWALPVPGTIISSPSIGANGTVFVGVNDGSSSSSYLYAVSQAGSALWTYKLEGTTNSSPTITSNGHIVIGTTDGRIYAIDGGTTLADTPWPMFRNNLLHTGRQ